MESKSHNLKSLLSCHEIVQQILEYFTKPTQDTSYFMKFLKGENIVLWSVHTKHKTVITPAVVVK